MTNLRRRATNVEQWGAAWAAPCGDRFGPNFSSAIVALSEACAPGRDGFRRRALRAYGGGTRRTACQL